MHPDYRVGINALIQLYENQRIFDPLYTAMQKRETVESNVNAKEHFKSSTTILGKAGPDLRGQENEGSSLALFSRHGIN